MCQSKLVFLAVNYPYGKRWHNFTIGSGLLYINLMYTPQKIEEDYQNHFVTTDSFEINTFSIPNPLPRQRRIEALTCIGQELLLFYYMQINQEVIT